jgi:hypothetical protein
MRERREEEDPEEAALALLRGVAMPPLLLANCL